jgi:hypothetical protein
MPTTRRSLLKAFGASPMLALARPAHAQTIVHVDRSSPDRRAILDVVRAPVQQTLGINVVFVVKRLAIYGDWAFADLAPRTEAGAKIDYRRTRISRDFHPDLDSDTMLALVRRSGASWTLVEQALLPTDVAWEEWREKYRLPRRLFVEE